MVNLQNVRPGPIVAILLMLFVVMAGLIPAIYTNTQGPQTKSLTLEQGDTKEVQNPLQISINSLDETDLNATLTDTSTGETANIISLQRTQTREIMLNEESVNVTYQEYLAFNRGIVVVEYPALFQSNNTSTDLARLIGLIVVVLFLYMVLSLVNMGDES